MKKGIKGLIIVLLLVTAPLIGMAQDQEEPVRKKKGSEVRYFSKGSFFVYVIGTSNFFDPPADYYLDLGGESVTGFAPMFGAGWRMIAFGNRMFMNLTFDYVPAKFDFPYSTDQKIDMYTLMVDLEGVFFRDTPLSLNLGFGVTFVRFKDLGYWDAWDEWVHVGDDTVTGMAIEFGMKYALSKHLFLRGIVRLTGEVYPEYYYDEFYDEYYESDDSDFVRMNTAIGIGVEFHF
jgi:opacity protein-like surface antigen